MAPTSPILSTLNVNRALLHHTFEGYKLKIDGELERVRGAPLQPAALRYSPPNATTKGSFRWAGIIRNALVPCDEHGGSLFVDSELHIVYARSPGDMSVVFQLPRTAEPSAWVTLGVPGPGYVLACDGEGLFHLVRWAGPGDASTVVRSFRTAKTARATEILDCCMDDAGTLSLLASWYDAEADAADPGTSLPSRSRPGLGSRDFGGRREATVAEKLVFGVSFATVDGNAGEEVASFELRSSAPALCGYLEASFGGAQSAFFVVGTSDFVSTSVGTRSAPLGAEVPSGPAEEFTTMMEEGPEALDSAKDPEQPNLLSQLESADVISSPPTYIWRFDAAVGGCTHVNNCAGNAFLSPGVRARGIPPELLFGYDVDGAVYALKAGSAEAEHVCSLPALAYIAASKKEKKFASYTASYDFFFVIEGSRLGFFYSTPDAGVRTSNQYVVDFNEGGSVLGFAQTGADTLLVLKESAMYEIVLVRREQVDAGRGAGPVSRLDELLDRTGDTQLSGLMGDY
ncbi:hypothetical protein DFJ74DRAFT_661968 [Hyaloraphidium curvatum]|nr:hypothetical protein DFJ74DRAFT_661968 [Hyaloraphidium curvatum]